MDSFGQEHKDLVISSIWRRIRYQQFRLNEVIFKEGDVSNGKMFVVISGEVSVAIKKKINVFEEENKKQQQKEEQERKQKTEGSQRSIDLNNNSKESKDNDNNEEDNDEAEPFTPNTPNPQSILLRKLGRKETLSLNKMKSISTPSNKINTPMNRQKIKRDQSIFSFDPATLGDVIAKLGNGFSFGEKAIMEEGGIRMASIFASQETEALVIMREDFLSIKKMIESAKRDKIFLIKSAIPGISNVNSWEILEQLGYVFNEQKFLKNDYLSLQGEKSNTIYLLVNGKLEVTSLIEMEIEDPQQKYMSKLNKFTKFSNHESPPLQQLISKKEKNDQNNKSFNNSNTEKLKDEEKSQYQTVKEQLEIKICDIDTPQFVCEDILAFRQQQYNVKVISSKALCYVITKRQFQSKFPRESVEMTKQLFLSKQKRRTDVINEQLNKYKDKFKIVERQESLIQQNKMFKQKFKKQYLSNIYAQSILKTTEKQKIKNKELVYEYEKSDEQQKKDKLLQQIKFTEAKQFLSSMPFNPDILHMNDFSCSNKEYFLGINEMKQHFSDYILDCVKKSIESNCILTFKQRQSINNHSNHNINNNNNSSFTRNSNHNLFSSKKLSVIDEDNSNPPDTKRSSIFSNSSKNLRFSISQSPSHSHNILRGSIDINSSKDQLYKKLLIKLGSKQEMDNQDGKGSRRSSYFKVSPMNDKTPSNKNNNIQRGSQEFRLRSESKESKSDQENNQEDNIKIDKYYKIEQNKRVSIETQNEQGLSITNSCCDSSSQEILNFTSMYTNTNHPSQYQIHHKKSIVQESQNQIINDKQRDSIFKQKKQINLELLQPLKLTNQNNSSSPLSDKLFLNKKLSNSSQLKSDDTSSPIFGKTPLHNVNLNDPILINSNHNIDDDNNNKSNNSNNISRNEMSPLLKLYQKNNSQNLKLDSPINMNSNSFNLNSPLNSKQFQHQQQQLLLQQQLQGGQQNYDEEKSLLLEGTWNMGYGNLKQLEMDLKQELRNRGLLKIDSSQKTEIKNYFPQLDKYQREKIEQKIQKIKLQQQKLEQNPIYSSINKSKQSDIQDQQTQFSSNKKIKTQPTFSSIESSKNNNHSQIISNNVNNNEQQVQIINLNEYQRQNPLVRIDGGTQQKQYSSPVIQARSSINHNSIEPPLFLPKVPSNKNIFQRNFSHQNLKQQQHSSDSNNKNNVIIEGLNNNNVLIHGSSSFNSSPINKYDMSTKNVSNTDEFNYLKGFKCGSPISQKVSSPSYTPRSILYKSGQSILDNSSKHFNNCNNNGQNKDIQNNQSYLSCNSRIKSISQSQPIKQLVMKDAVIQTQNNYPTTKYDFYSSDSLLQSSNNNNGGNSNKKKESDNIFKKQYNASTQQTSSSLSSSQQQHQLQQSQSNQAFSMLQRINYQRPIIFHNIMNRERRPYQSNNHPL